MLSERHVVVDTRINQVRIFEAAPPPSSSEEETTRTGAGLVNPSSAEPRAWSPPSPSPRASRSSSTLGTWELRNMRRTAVWRYDQQLLDTGKRSENALNIPPGPNSPVGIIWNGLSRPGIGLHGTSDPETIGRARSAGCIRLANWDAIRLPTLIRPVTITGLGALSALGTDVGRHREIR
jgi:lipoprotein-anchoring transpeptidase ErfK/SrfK